MVAATTLAAASLAASAASAQETPPPGYDYYDCDSLSLFELLFGYLPVGIGCKPVPQDEANAMCSTDTALYGLLPVQLGCTELP